MKYECVSLHAFGTGSELRAGLARYIGYYNAERPHSSLKHKIPEAFAAARPFDKTQWAQTLELSAGSAPAPIAHAAE